MPTHDWRADDSVVKKYKYPANDTIYDPEGYREQLAAYGAAYEVYAGPKGWTGNGRYESGWGTTVVLYPPGGSDTTGPSITFRKINSNCKACLWTTALRYFPEAVK